MTEKEKLESLYAMTQSDGWTQVFQPALERKRNSLLKEVLTADPSDPMTHQRVGIRILDFILDSGGNAAILLKRLEEAEQESSAFHWVSGSPYDPARRVVQ